MTMPKISLLTLFAAASFLLPAAALADAFDLSVVKSQFANFVRCELTRTDADNHFSGQPFKITMVDLFDVRTESDHTIVTGAVQCFVNKTYKTLYVAVGTKMILDQQEVVYYTIRKKDFSILATELFRFPYKERCKFSQYWIDID